MKKVPPSEVKNQVLKDLLSGRNKEINGKEYLSELVKVSFEKILQEALEDEQQSKLGRSHYERGGENGVYRNGYEDGTLKTSEGIFNIKIPQIRGLEGPYQSKIWQKIHRTSENLKDLVLEMYTCGMSQRDIENSLEKVFGRFVLSKSSVSVMTEELYEQYREFKKRDLSGYEVAYLYLDAVYEPLRRYGTKTGILCCWGRLVDGSKVLFDLMVANTESYESCMEFLRGMVSRGLETPLTITTDGALGLIKSVEHMWPESKRIRCWFHKMQNLQSKVSPEEWSEFKSLVEDMRDAPTKKEAIERKENIIKKYNPVYPEACTCLTDDLEASLNHLIVPHRHRIHVRTTNLIERTFVEERRRTKIIPHMWDQKSLTKLVFSVLIRVNEKWLTRQYSTMEQKQIIKLKEQYLNNKISTKDITDKKRVRRSVTRVA